MLVLLILQCVRETMPFLVYFIIWMEFFIALNRILGATVGDQIPGIEVSTSNFINMFRASVGDLQNPIYDYRDSTFRWVIVGIWSTYVVIIYI